MTEMWEFLKDFVTTENIALLSVIITVLIFVISRRAELKYKKHDDKKTQYLKLIKLLEKVFIAQKEKPIGEIKPTNELMQQFFDVGASLLLYGSRKLYKQYLFFREISSNPLIKQCKFYSDDIKIPLGRCIMKIIDKHKKSK